MKFLKIFSTLIFILGLTYFLGPRPDALNLTGVVPPVEKDLIALEKFIDSKEDVTPNIKHGNEAEIIWLDDNKKVKTEYSLLYLPGFSGSHYEAEPLHKEFGKLYNCNVYLARLQAHGLDEAESLLDFDAEKYLQSAREALAIAQAIGEKVIIMSTSTGSTLALALTAENPSVHALINYSPNIDLYDPRSGLLNGPWGLQIARLVKGGNYYEWEAPEPWTYKYWNLKYRLEGLIELKEFIDMTMTEETFEKINQPFFMGYWFKNEEEKDMTVSIERMEEMYSQISTEDAVKVKKVYPEAKTHVIACKTRAKQYEQVRQDTFDFAEKVLGLKRVKYW
ncbi:MAG: pimeloyl-ACP methyl ester carboxylesterase [Patiriisocius sp.]|jgi:pimeloyl-ACP methyl ester carboxylesterase